MFKQVSHTKQNKILWLFSQEEVRRNHRFQIPPTKYE